MADNLKIGATVDKAGVEEGFTSVQDLTQKVTQKIAISFEECSARTKGAMRGISEDVKAAAATVSAESLKVAEATRLQSSAIADLRRATIVAKDTNVDAAVSTGLLAAAQDKAAAAAAGLAGAKKAEAAAVAEASEEEALSTNLIIAAFQRVARSVSESLEVVREQLAETAEYGNVTAEGIHAGFSGLGNLLGAGLAIGFGAEFLDDLAKANVELDHLSVKSGISAVSLAGLEQIVKEAGGDWDAVSTGLVKMERAQGQVENGNKKLVQAFGDLGIKQEEVKAAKPEELFLRLADAMGKAENQSKLVNSAQQIFGKGGAALIPILREQGSALGENITKAAALTGITNEAIEASRRWTQDVARLATQFRSVMIPVLEHAGDVIAGVAGAFEAAAASLVTVAEVIGAAFTSAGAELVAVGKLLYDVTSGNAGALVADTAAVKNAFTDQWKGAFRDIGEAWKEVENRFKAPPPVPQLPELTGGDTSDSTDRTKKVTAVERDEEELNQVKLEAAGRGYAVGIDQEVRFWQAKLSAAKKGSEEYREILAKLAPLEEEQSKRKTPVIATESEDGSLKEVEREFIEANEAKLKSDQETAKEGAAAVREEQAEKIRIADEGYRDAEKDSEDQVQLGKATAAERIQALKAAADQEYQLKLQATSLLELLDLANAQKYQADLTRELAATREHTRQIMQLNQQAALLTQKEWTAAFDGLSNQFNKLVLSMINSNRSLSQDFATVWKGIATTFTTNLLKMTEQEILAALLHKDLLKQGIIADAHKAASGAYQAVSGIPVVGPVLAPVAAAAAFAGVLAFQSFNAGGVVKGGSHVPILAEGGERVLTPGQTQNFEKLANGKGAAAPGRGDVHTHLHYNGQVNAYDKSGMRSTLKAHAEDILDIVRDGYRAGSLA